MEYNKSSFSTRISTELILSIGSDDFVLKLSEALSDFLQFDHLTLFTFDSHLIPHLIAGSSGGEPTTTSRISQLYKKSHYYCDDPNTQLIGGNNKKAVAPLIQQLHAKDIKNDAYRKFIYEDNNLLDRVSIIDHENQRWFIVNFYRNVGRDYFSKHTLDFLHQNASLISALIKRHLSTSSSIDWKARTVPPIAELEVLISSLGGDLSSREIDVCARVMQGMTREGVSLDLNLKPPTVATYMGRAYAKLNISSLNELFALCLAQLSSKSDFE